MGQTETQDPELTPEPQDQSEPENAEGEYVDPDAVQDDPAVEEPETVVMTVEEKAMYDKRIADKDAFIKQLELENREGERKHLELLQRVYQPPQAAQDPVEEIDLNEPMTRGEFIEAEKRKQAQAVFSTAKAKVEADAMTFKQRHPELESDPELQAALRKEFAELNQFDFHNVPPEEILKRQNVFGKNLEVALAIAKASKGNGTVTTSPKPIPPRTAGAVGASGRPAMTAPAQTAPKVYARKDFAAAAEEKLKAMVGLK